MQTIRLVVFNEDYWDNNLIYTQNILPLKSLADSVNGQLELFSFTSLPVYLMQRKRIKGFVEKMAERNVKVVNKLVLFYPTRYLLPFYILLPFFYLNVYFYMKALRKSDKGRNVINNMRSYCPALAFYKYYGRLDNVFFDPRTEWIEENINAGYFKSGSRTVKFWSELEKEFVKNFHKTILISDIFKDNLIKKCGSKYEDKMCVLYNPIDYKQFAIEKRPHNGKVFLYTGSLGHWNNLVTYLDFFKMFIEQGMECRLIICTNTAQKKIDEIVCREEYAQIKNAVIVHYNVPCDKLPVYYSECDYGLQLMSLPDSRVGVKYVEYIAAGLIPIVNSNVKGAAFLSKKYGFGPVIENQDNKEEIINKVVNALPLDVNSAQYLEFKQQSDLNELGCILKKIYLDEHEEV